MTGAGISSSAGSENLRRLRLHLGPKGPHQFLKEDKRKKERGESGWTTDDRNDPARLDLQTESSTSKEMTDIPVVSPCSVGAFELPSPSNEIAEMLSKGGEAVDENPWQQFVNMFTPQMKNPRSGLNDIAPAPQIDVASVYDVESEVGTGKKSPLEHIANFFGGKIASSDEKITSDVDVEPNLEPGKAHQKNAQMEEIKNGFGQLSQLFSPQRETPNHGFEGCEETSQLEETNSIADLYAENATSEEEPAKHDIDVGGKNLIDNLADIFIAKEKACGDEKETEFPMQSADLDAEPEIKINEKEETQQNPLKHFTTLFTPRKEKHKNVVEESDSVLEEDEIAGLGGTGQDESRAEQEKPNPFQHIANILSPKPESSSVDGKNKIAPLEEDFFNELVREEDVIAGLGGTGQDESRAEQAKPNPFQHIANVFSPKPERSSVDGKNKIAPLEEDFFNELNENSAQTAERPGRKVEEVNIFDHLREMVSAFTPQRPDSKESPGLTQCSSMEQLETPMSEQSRRLDFEPEVFQQEENVTRTTEREVATVQDLYIDATKGLAQIFDSAKRVDTKELIERACQVNAKELASLVQKQASEFAVKARETKRRFIDLTKDVEPQQVLRTAQKSADEVAQNVRTNAKFHPYPWFVIATISVMIMVNMIFFRESVGSTTMQQNKVLIKIHCPSAIPGASRKPEEIVREVVEFLKQEMDANEVDQLIDEASTSWRNNSGVIESGQEIVARVCERLQHLEDSADFPPRRPLNAVGEKSKDFFLYAKDCLASDEATLL